MCFEHRSDKSQLRLHVTACRDQRKNYHAPVETLSWFPKQHKAQEKNDIFPLALTVNDPCKFFAERITEYTN